MTDLYEILQGRLDDLNRRRDEENARHAAVIRTLEKDRGILLDMLALEKKLDDAGSKDILEYGPLRPGAANALENEILNALSSRKECEHSVLKAWLIKRGFGSDDSQFGRSLQGTLLSMRARELVELVGNGLWRLSSDYSENG